jgi:tetratricopeptide (TPR) repeat protein
VAPLAAGSAYADACRAGVRAWASEVVTTGSDAHARTALASWQHTWGLGNAWLSHAAAEVFLKLGDVDAAAAAIGDAWRSGDACVGVCQTAADIANRRGDASLRLEVLQRASTLTGFDALLAHELSEALSAAGRGQAAYDAIRGFLANNPDSARAHHTASVMAERLGHLAVAVSHSTRVVDLAPPHVENYLVRLADLRRVAGDLDAAAAALDRANALGQTSPWAQQVRSAIDQARAGR